MDIYSPFSLLFYSPVPPFADVYAMTDNATSGDSLRARCLRAGGWVGAGKSLIYVIRTLRMWALTLLLAPEAFGTLALVWAALNILREFSDTGLTQALIQNPQGEQAPYLNAAWWIRLCRNLLLAAVMTATAPYVATSFYHNPELTGPLRWAGLILVFEGLTSISTIVLQKKLHFHTLIKMDCGAQLAGTVAAIAFSWYLRNPMGVIIGEITAAAILCALSYMIHAFRPSPGLLWAAVKDLLSFGSIIFLTTIINAVAARLDIAILGKIAPEAELGLYSLALTAILLPCALLSSLSINVGLPALATVQHERERLHSNFNRMIRYIVAAAIPLFAGIALLAGYIVRVLPERYVGIEEPLRHLALFGFLVVFIRLFSPLLHATRNHRWMIWLSLLRMAAIAVTIGGFYSRWGLSGVCWSLILSQGVSIALIMVIVKRTLDWSVRRWWRDLTPVIRALLMALALATPTFGFIRYLLCDPLITDDNAWIIGYGIGLAVYAGMLCFHYRLTLRRLLRRTV